MAMPRRYQRALRSNAYEEFPWLKDVPVVWHGQGALRVLKTSREVVQAGLELHNCLASSLTNGHYMTKLRNKEIALVVLEVDGKLQAVGELRFQMGVEDGHFWDFSERLDEIDLLRPLSACGTSADWKEAEEGVRVFLEEWTGYDAWLPGWRECLERGNADIRREFEEMFDGAEQELIQHLVRAWVRAEMHGAKELEFPWLSRGPRFACEVAYALEFNNTLLSLDLTDHAVSTEGVGALVQAVRKDGPLERLVLGDNFLDDEAAEELARSLRENSHVRSLGLASNLITDFGARAFLPVLEVNSSLVEVDLRDNEVTSASLACVARIKLH